MTRFFVPTILVASLGLAGPAEAIEFQAFSGDRVCPQGFRLATFADASAERAGACRVLGPWYIARLAEGGSMDGPEYGCKVRNSDSRALGHTLCVRTPDALVPLVFGAFPGDGCPGGYRFATFQEASSQKEAACRVLGPWYIARLAGGGSMDGPSYECKVRETDARQLGHSLCVMLRPTSQPAAYEQMCTSACRTIRVNYKETIPAAECDFPDCRIESGKSEARLPTSWGSASGQACEHTQAGYRLPDRAGKAYFMFSNSQDNGGYLWVVEVPIANSDEPWHLAANGAIIDGRVVWWDRINDPACHTLPKGCNDPGSEGRFNHPARIAGVGPLVAVAMQNFYSNWGRCPDRPSGRGSDSVNFYDVGDPRRPRFLKQMNGVNGLLPGLPNDVSEVGLWRLNDDFHLSAYDEKPGYNYRLQSPLQDVPAASIGPGMPGNFLLAYRWAPGGAGDQPTKFQLEYSGSSDEWWIRGGPLSYNTTPSNRLDASVTSFQIGELKQLGNKCNQPNRLRPPEHGGKYPCEAAKGLTPHPSGGFTAFCHSAKPYSHDGGGFIVQTCPPKK